MHRSQLCAVQGNQFKYKLTNNQSKAMKPTDDGVFDFLVLVVWSWNVVAKGYGQTVPASSPSHASLRSQQQRMIFEQGQNPLDSTHSPSDPHTVGTPPPVPGSAHTAPVVSAHTTPESISAPATPSPNATNELQKIHIQLKEFFSRCSEVRYCCFGVIPCLVPPCL